MTKQQIIDTATEWIEKAYYSQEPLEDILEEFANAVFESDSEDSRNEEIRNLDVAARDFVEAEWDGKYATTEDDALFTQDYIEYAFKAGAEWMAEQGVILEEEVLSYEPTDSPHDTLRLGKIH